MEVIFQKKSYLRVLSLLTVILFTVFDLFFFPSQAMGVSILENIPVRGGEVSEALSNRPQALSIEIPPEFGKIDEVYFRGTEYGVQSTAHGIKEKHLTPYPLRPTMIYIQDAHDSLEAQKNIAKIIQHLVRNYGVKTVFEEGYEGPVPTDEYFDFIQDPKIRRKISYFLLDRLRIGAAEYAHINRADSGQRTAYKVQRTDSNTQRAADNRRDEGKGQVNLNAEHYTLNADWNLIGADSLKLHRKNLKQYQKAWEVQGEILRDLDLLESKIRKLISLSLPKEVKAWLKIYEKQQNGELPYGDYLRRLMEFSPRGENLFSRDKYPQLNLFFKAIEDKGDIQMSSPRKDKSASRQELRENAGRDLKAGFDLDVIPAEAGILDSRLNRSGMTSSSGESSRFGIRPAGNDAMSINPQELFQEVAAFEETFISNWLSKEKDRQLIAYFKTIQVLKRLSSLKVSQEEYQSIKETLRHFDTRKAAEFIFTETKKPVLLSRQWEKNIREVFKFYNIVAERDRAISGALEKYWLDDAQIRNSKSEIRNKPKIKNSNIQNKTGASFEHSNLDIVSDFEFNHSEFAVLVYGGFHKESIKRILKEKNISCIVVSPKITEASPRHEKYYQELMTEGYKPLTVLPALLHTLLNPARIFTAGSPREVRTLYDQFLLWENIRGQSHRHELRDSKLNMSRYPAVLTADDGREFELEYTRGYDFNLFKGPPEVDTNAFSIQVKSRGEHVGYADFFLKGEMDISHADRRSGTMGAAIRVYDEFREEYRGLGTALMVLAFRLSRQTEAEKFKVSNAYRKEKFYRDQLKMTPMDDETFQIDLNDDSLARVPEIKITRRDKVNAGIRTPLKPGMFVHGILAGALAVSFVAANVGFAENYQRFLDAANWFEEGALKSLICGLAASIGKYTSQVLGVYLTGTKERIEAAKILKWGLAGVLVMGPLGYWLWLNLLTWLPVSAFIKALLGVTFYTYVIGNPVKFKLQQMIEGSAKLNGAQTKHYSRKLLLINIAIWFPVLLIGWTSFKAYIVLVTASFSIIWSILYTFLLDRWTKNSETTGESSTGIQDKTAGEVSTPDTRLELRREDSFSTNTDVYLRSAATMMDGVRALLSPKIDFYEQFGAELRGEQGEAEYKQILETYNQLGQAHNAFNRYFLDHGAEDKDALSDIWKAMQGILPGLIRTKDILKSDIDTKIEMEYLIYLWPQIEDFLAKGIRSELRTDDMFKNESEVVAGDILETNQGKKYRVIQILGATSWGGQTLEAQEAGKSSALKGPVVFIKTLPLSGTDKARNYKFYPEYIRNEALILEKLNQSAPGLAPEYYGHGTSSERNAIFIVEEKLSGQSLGDWLLKLKKVSPPKRIRIFLKIAGAIQKMHEAGVIHRDFNLANILVADPAADQIKIIDFQFAYSRHAEKDILETLSETHPGSIHGTLAFVPPEMSRRVDPPTYRKESYDIFSLGVLLYYLLTGSFLISRSKWSKEKALFSFTEGLSPEIIREALPRSGKDYADIIFKAVNPSPHKRYQSVREMTEAVEELPEEAGMRRLMRDLFKRAELREKMMLIDSKLAAHVLDVWPEEFSVKRFGDLDEETQNGFLAQLGLERGMMDKEHELIIAYWQGQFAGGAWFFNGQNSGEVVLREIFVLPQYRNSKSFFVMRILKNIAGRDVILGHLFDRYFGKDKYIALRLLETSFTYFKEQGIRNIRVPNILHSKAALGLQKRFLDIHRSDSEAWNNIQITGYWNLIFRMYSWQTEHLQEFQSRIPEDVWQQLMPVHGKAKLSASNLPPSASNTRAELHQTEWPGTGSALQAFPAKSELPSSRTELRTISSSDASHPRRELPSSRTELRTIPSSDASHPRRELPSSRVEPRIVSHPSLRGAQKGDAAISEIASPTARNDKNSSASRSERRLVPAEPSTARPKNPADFRAELPLIPTESETVRPKNPADFRAELRNVRKWDETSILNQMRQLKPEQLTPTWLKAHDLGGMYHAARREFGSWEAALTAGGKTEEEAKRSQRWTEETIRQYIQDHQAEPEKLNPVWLNEHGLNHLYKRGRKIFGSWRDALKTAGVDPKDVYRREKWTRDNLLEKIRTLQVNQLNYAWLKVHGLESFYLAAKNEFGRWEDALVEAEIDPEDVYQRVPVWTKEGILRYLKKHQSENLQSGHIHQHHPGLYLAAVREFGSWRQALEAAGLDPEKIYLYHRIWTEESILDFIRQSNGEISLVPSEIQKGPIASVYHAAIRIFGSWWIALERAGVDPRTVYERIPWTRELVVYELNKLTPEQQTNAFLRRNRNGLLKAAQREFGSLPKAFQAAREEKEKGGETSKTLKSSIKQGNVKTITIVFDDENEDLIRKYGKILTLKWDSRKAGDFNTLRAVLYTALRLDDYSGFFDQDYDIYVDGKPVGFPSERDEILGNLDSVGLFDEPWDGMVIRVGRRREDWIVDEALESAGAEESKTAANGENVQIPAVPAVSEKTPDVKPESVLKFLSENLTIAINLLRRPGFKWTEPPPAGTVFFQIDEMLGSLRENISLELQAQMSRYRELVNQKKEMVEPKVNQPKPVELVPVKPVVTPPAAIEQAPASHGVVLPRAVESSGPSMDKKSRHKRLDKRMRRIHVATQELADLFTEDGESIAAVIEKDTEELAISSVDIVDEIQQSVQELQMSVAELLADQDIKGYERETRYALPEQSKNLLLKAMAVLNELGNDKSERHELREMSQTVSALSQKRMLMVDFKDMARFSAEQIEEVLALPGMEDQHVDQVEIYGANLSDNMDFYRGLEALIAQWEKIYPNLKGAIHLTNQSFSQIMATNVRKHQGPVLYLFKESLQNASKILEWDPEGKVIPVRYSQSGNLIATAGTLTAANRFAGSLVELLKRKASLLRENLPQGIVYRQNYFEVSEPFRQTEWQNLAQQMNLVLVIGQAA